MRLIDADALKKDWSMANKCEECPQNARKCPYEQNFTRMDICEMLDEAPTVGGWISVKDRLPEEKQEALIFCCWTGASGEVYREIMIENIKSVIYQGYEPIAWMPLPEPPKGGDA